MEKAKHSVRFETTVGDDGSVTFSKKVDGLQLAPGHRVTVSIFGGIISRTLRRINATEEEIETIGAVQLEDREHVMRFLASQGSLAGSSFRTRMPRA